MAYQSSRDVDHLQQAPLLWRRDLLQPLLLICAAAHNAAAALLCKALLLSPEWVGHALRCG